MLVKRVMASALSWALIVGLSTCEVVAQEAAPTPPLAVQRAPVTTETLQQLVAPIALYPDELVAQVLAAATYPTQVVEADRWVQEHSDLKGQELAQALDE